MTDKQPTRVNRWARYAAEPGHRITEYLIAWKSPNGWTANYSDGTWVFAGVEDMSERDRGFAEAYLALLPVVYYIVPFVVIRTAIPYLPEGPVVYISLLLLVLIGAVIYLSSKQLADISVVVDNV